ncbi:hypothetical protein Mgra_00006462 [Meloidogyne graminicola]|uniref:Uncharacterized protein n=1 Tax=Meloidogyne graminicola TaxID=189291 RepID=A0A8S9ZLA7_9BILA|nr:hypothetical protein Mgra_00006462 [Meloidogyne graminicola]
MEALSNDHDHFHRFSIIKNNKSPVFYPSSPSSSSASSSPYGSDFDQRIKNNNLVGKRFYVSKVQSSIYDNEQQKILKIQTKNDEPENEENNKKIEYSDDLESKINFVEPSKNLKTRVEKADEELICFRYTWPVKITERLISLGETAILNVSPPFCTAYNGVQFTWLLRICEENILDIGASNDNTLNGGFNYEENKDNFIGKKKVNITLYYKDGPARDVKLHGGEITILDSKGLVFKEMPLCELEYIKGGGWSPINNLSNKNNNDLISDEQLKFINFIHSNVGKYIAVRIKLEMPVSLFQPLQYLPSIDSPLSDKLETLCAQVLEEIRSNQLSVPDVEFFDPKTDKYALYRHVYLFACQVIFERFNDENEKKNNSNELIEKIQNIFAHYYFNKVIVCNAECFEDFLEALDASMHVQFPALRRECERYICAEVIAESTDLSLAKKMLILAARFNLPVLKMVSFGVIVDRLLLLQDGYIQNNSNSSSPIILNEENNIPSGGSVFNRKLARASEDSGNMTLENSMDEIREELLEIAEKINHFDHNQQSSSDNLNTQKNTNQKQKQLKFRRQHSNSLCSPIATNIQFFKNIKKSSTTFLSNSGLLNDKNEANEEDEDDNEEEDEDSDDFEPGNETLVGNVVEQLEQMARYIRKVSMPPGASPAPLLQNAENNEDLIIASTSSHINELNNNRNLNNRRSSLMTCREMLLQEENKEETFFSQLYAGSKLNNKNKTNFDEIQKDRENSLTQQNYKSNALSNSSRALTINNNVVIIDQSSVKNEEMKQNSFNKYEDDEGIVFDNENDKIGEF